jgi:hypothetical protein
MSASGIPVRIPPTARSPQVGAPRFSPKNFASTSATQIFANSDGCRLKAPSGIQRRAPLLSCPNSST